MDKQIQSQSHLSDTNDQTHRRIKSFVLRQGRMTEGQQLALKNLWPVFGLGGRLGEPGLEHILDFQQIFNNQNPIILEIGFGMGDSLLAMAQQNPQINYIGIEVHTPGIGHILQGISDFKLNNIRIFHADAIKVLQNNIAAETLQAVYLYFPDPWQKRRHQKRRIVKEQFIHMIYSRLQVNGLFHMATDWQDYAVNMLKEMKHTIKHSLSAPEIPKLHFINQSDTDTYINRPDWRPKTKFEKKGLIKGHEVWDILYQKVP